MFIPGTCDKWVAGSNDGQHARASVGKEYLATHSFPHTLSTMAYAVHQLNQSRSLERSLIDSLTRPPIALSIIRSLDHSLVLTHVVDSFDPVQVLTPLYIPDTSYRIVDHFLSLTHSIRSLVFDFQIISQEFIF